MSAPIRHRRPVPDRVAAALELRNGARTTPRDPRRGPSRRNCEQAAIRDSVRDHL